MVTTLYEVVISYKISLLRIFFLSLFLLYPELKLSSSFFFLLLLPHLPRECSKAHWVSFVPDMMPKEPRMKFFFPPYFFFASALKSPTLICSTLRHDARCVFRCRHGVWRFIFIFHFSSLLHTPSSLSSSCMCMRGAQSSDGSSSSTGNSLCSLGGLIFFLHIFLLSFTSSQRAARQMTSCVIYKGMMTSANDERVDGVRNLINKRATAEEAVALFSLHFFFLSSAWYLIASLPFSLCALACRAMSLLLLPLW